MEKKKQKDTKIKAAIQKRLKAIDGKHSKFINSMLERNKALIKIDRALEKEMNGNINLVTMPKEVNRVVANEFKNNSGTIQEEKSCF